VPSHGEIEGAEFLRQPNRLVDDTLLLVVVVEFYEAGERKVLTQRMPFETVICQDAPHVGMTGEQHAVEIVGLALEPIGSGENFHDRRHRRRLIDLDLDPDAPVPLR